MPGKTPSVEKIIKKYQMRQQMNLINHKTKGKGSINPIVKQKDHIEAAHFYSFNDKNNLNWKQQNQKTQKKKDQFGGDTTRRQYQSDAQNTDSDILKMKLIQMQSYTMKIEKKNQNLLQKYEKMVEKNQILNKQLEYIEQTQLADFIKLKDHFTILQTQNKHLQDSTGMKQGNTMMLRQKLREKNQKILQLQTEMAKLKDDFQFLIENTNIKASQQVQTNTKFHDKQSTITILKEQLKRFEEMIKEKDTDNKQLLYEIERVRLNNREQIQILKIGFTKIQDQYKNWIQESNKEKVNMVQSYEIKLRQCNEIINNHSLKMMVQTKDKETFEVFQTEKKIMNKDFSEKIELIKNLKIEFEKSEKLKLQLIQKVSFLENSMVQKNEILRQSNKQKDKLLSLLGAQQQKNKQITEKYNTLNYQFVELKAKCQIIFSQVECSKTNRYSQKNEIKCLKKQLQFYKQQKDCSKTNDFNLNSKLTETVSMLRVELTKIQTQKDQMEQDLYAERLENVKLKEELQETKLYLKREYQLLIDNTRRQLEQRITSLQYDKNVSDSLIDVDKHTIYLQLRELQKKYEVLESEIVTVDELKNIANKINRTTVSNKPNNAKHCRY